MSDVPDVTEENPNIHYRESLTIWGETCSAQMRGLAGMALHHYEGAPRSPGDGQTFELSTLDAVLLRDLLNAATERGHLPRPGTAYRSTTELQSGDQILVGVNGDLARVIGQMTVKDGGTREEWLTIVVPKAALFRVEARPDG